MLNAKNKLLEKNENDGYLSMGEDANERTPLISDVASNGAQSKGIKCIEWNIFWRYFPILTKSVIGSWLIFITLFINVIGR